MWEALFACQVSLQLLPHIVLLLRFTPENLKSGATGEPTNLEIGFCFYWSFAHAYIGYNNYPALSSWYTTASTFGFDEGGTAAVYVSVDVSNTTHVSIQLCNSTEYDAVVNSAYRYRSEAQCLPYPCSMGAVARGSNTFTIPSRDVYSLVLVNCGKAISLNMNYTFSNPNGCALNYGYCPMPLLSTICWVGWIVVMAAWLAAEIHMRLYSTDMQWTHIHSAIFVMILLRVSSNLNATIYWMSLQKSNASLDVVSYASEVISCVSEAYFFGMLLVIARGWLIIRSVVKTPEIRVIAFASAILLGTSLFFTFYKTNYFFLELIVLYFFILPKLVASIARSRRLIALHIRVIESTSFLPEITRNAHGMSLDHIPAMLKKYNMFGYFRLGIIAFFTLYLGSVGVHLFTPWYAAWIVYLFSEAIMLLMIVFLSFLLSPRQWIIFTPPYIVSNNGVLPFKLEDDGDDDQTPLSDIMVIEYPHNISPFTDYDNACTPGSLPDGDRTLNHSPNRFPIAFAIPETLLSNEAVTAPELMETELIVSTPYT
ncbi:hypothetical protein PROFUN_05326 [Planoprotostelium fungivorum]|uniref:GPR180/TMEM145 transmembrane domain-containing protein n=1 Tax=Planoprotostelium fungivorum TaxID=1890364 RepID=A0A2P6NR14_9EUKA|nr:hypothetical protein PROFUN_05326 [Planoprotostelium fungivorum]